MKKTNLIIILILILVIPNIYAQEISQKEAQTAIDTAILTIAEMKTIGLPTQAVEDLWHNAEEALEKAKFAQKIKNNTRNNTISNETKTILRGLDYPEFKFSNVLKYTQQIQEKQKQMYQLLDEINIIETKLDESNKKGIASKYSNTLFADIKYAFKNERLKETEKLLNELNQQIDKEKAEHATANILITSSKSFLIKHAYEIIVVLILIIATTWIVIGSYQKNKIKQKIKKLEHEEKVLKKLMIRAQEARYRDGTMPEFVFQIRMKNFKKKLNRIHETLPSLKAELKKKNTKKKTKREKY